MKVTFRISFEYIKENIDIPNYLTGLGKDLFLVSHEKPGNYHYHGLLDISTTVKTFRNKCKELLDPLVEIPKGFRPISISDKVSDANGYKSYCLYRSGHPIKHIVVDENLEELKKISEKKIKPKDKPSKLKMETDLEDILESITEQQSRTIRSIVDVIVKHYMTNKRVIHIVDIQRLAWTVYTHTHGTKQLVEHIITDEKAGFHAIDDIDRRAEREQTYKHKYTQLLADYNEI